MQKINIETWGRKDTYLFYKDVDVPQYNMTFELDVTHFYEHVKSRKISFYLSFMFVAMHALNAIENFRYRYIHNEPYLLDKTHPSFTDKIDGTDRFKMVTVNLTDDLDSFLLSAKQTSEKQGSHFIDKAEESRDDLVYVTTFPWASFTQVSHAHNIDRFDAIPRIVWGKFRNVSDKLMMPFGIQAHHAFADGMHVGMLIQKIQEALDSFSL